MNYIVIVCLGILSIQSPIQASTELLGINPIKSLDQIEITRSEPKKDVKEPVREEIEPVDVPVVNKVLVGTFKVTHYGADCTGCTGAGITATGTQATEGRTVAVDFRIIPRGSTLEINGVQYIAEDTGIVGNIVDIYVGTEAYATQLGTYPCDIYLIE